MADPDYIPHIPEAQIPCIIKFCKIIPANPVNLTIYSNIDTLRYNL